MSKVWMITGASRGLGAAIARECLAAGEKVVATGRDAAAVEKAVGGSNPNLLCLALDVDDPAQAPAAIEAATAHFGRIDVLVNNAGYGQLGVFEQITPAQIDQQFRTNVFGVFDLTRAVLPGMRARGSGHIFNMSSMCGYQGGNRYSMYAATKFALEGFSESIATEVADFGIRITIVEPGFFRTDFLEPTSKKESEIVIDAYSEGDAVRSEATKARSGNQAGDPDKLARALIRLAHDDKPPLRFIVGADAVAMVERKNAFVAKELEKWRELSVSTDLDQP